jgi:hypothetical protein
MMVKLTLTRFSFRQGLVSLTQRHNFTEDTGVIQSETRFHYYICVNTIYALKNMQTPGFRIADMIFTSTLVPYPTNLSTQEYGQPKEV